jgi:glucosamine-6-phosphate deaminase
MRLIIENDYKALCQWTANYIAEKINSSPSDKPFVIGLPTGSSPLGVYQELIKKYKNGEVSFKNVVTFNMDEYIGLAEDHPQSYHYFMYENFFNHIDIKKENINILNGNTDNHTKECTRYEQKIEEVGGIDLFLGGVGSDGHIAFNEPGSSLSSTTRIKTLTRDTVIANSRFFDNDVDQVPKTALTVGVKTIMDAKEVLIIANGHAKALAVRHVVEESINHMWTVSALQLHNKAVFVCDEPAVAELKHGTVKYFINIEEQIANNPSLQ